MSANRDVDIKAVGNDDLDAEETREWLDALVAVIETDGVERGHYLIERLVDQARRMGANLPYSANTAYINTIPAHHEIRSPGDHGMEHRIRSLIRWNAMAMVVRANLKSTEYGGHIASFASSATLYDVAFNHFFHARSEHHGGDLIFFQGHSAPGIYARAYLEGRLTEQHLEKFRQEVEGGGLSSYPHPRLMKDFWQFPTVSMGLGPLMAIYQARFMKYLNDRQIVTAGGRKVWAFTGDGEMDEPESLGAIGMAGREKLDNLIFVVNCNCSAWMGLFGAMEKSSRNWRRIFAGPGGTLSRLFGGPIGIRCWQRIPMDCLENVWKKSWTESTRTIRPKAGHTPVNIFLADIPSCRKWSPICRMMISGV